MKVSFHLPLDKVTLGDEFVSPVALREMVTALESAGIDACFVTDHPIPSDRWLTTGGHHAVDPFVALSFAAAMSTRILLHFNILVLAYRNPFLTAKAVATLDVLSGGRVIVGAGAGYLEAEYAALGVPFEERGALMDEAIEVMTQVWAGQSVSFKGKHFEATGNTALPRPTQRPHPPLWIGGNSNPAIRRAVAVADGWSPFPLSSAASTRVRSSEITSVADLRTKIAFARELAAAQGRARALDICMVPFGVSMLDRQRPETAAMVDQLQQLAAVGVTWIAVSLPCADRSQYLDNVRWFAEEVRPAL